MAWLYVPGTTVSGSDCGSPCPPRAVCYVEREGPVASILAQRMVDGCLEPAPIWSDLSTFDGSRWHGLVDIITAGFPCQPVSRAGLRLEAADGRWLWPLVERTIRQVGCGVVFLENVPGLLDGRLGEVLGGLARLGFDAEWCSLSAGHCGAAHRRERIWILAHCDRIGFEAIRQAYHEYRCDEPWNELDRCSSGRSCNGCGFCSDEYSDEHVFPPGPESEFWRAAYEIAPDALAWEDQRQICGACDGPPGWVDRMRALGNGVVPIVAAAAFVLLARRALGV